MMFYWLLFAFAAAMALTFPIGRTQRLGAGQSLAVVTFALCYVALATLRYQIGGDWDNYDDMYRQISQDSLTQAMTDTDPLFGLILWLSAKAGLGIYPANGLCAGLIALGTLRVALATSEPWLAILMAVPYLLIVVGMGYVRQAGAIGFVMLAIAEIRTSRRGGWLVLLAAAAGMHATSVVTLPVFAMAMARRAKLAILPLVALGTAVFLYLLARRLAAYQLGYIDQEYDSGGAWVRMLMNLAPSLLLLACWRRFPYIGPTRDVWLGFALANVVALVAMRYSPSTTAVDRLALYFAPIQIVVFGSLKDILPFDRKSVFALRMAVIGIAACVQIVWLMLGTYAEYWVPYRSVLDLV